MEKAEEKLDIITKYFADFSPEQVQQLLSLEPLYREWNAKINVISRKDEEGLYVKHVLHSLSIGAVFDFRPGTQVLDLGTGGGFPGIPLAIFFPEVRFHLVDSIGKKIKVVEAVAEGAGLKNVTAQHVRVEDIKNRKFDVVVSRAVAPLGELWRWARPVIRENGRRERAEGKGQRAEGRGQRAEGKGQRAEGKGERAEGKGERAEAESLIVNRQTAKGNELALPVPNGLICLKGGDLSKEIAESGCRPRIMEIKEIFNEDVFKEKYLLYVPFKK
jgi:16S rRNA (guanine527-N7)-methyltransferase